jgi:mono/diheme cytochrome c family protein
MKRPWRGLGIAVASVAVLCIAACIVIYAMAERVLRRTYPVPAIAMTIPVDADSIREGERLARVRGCVDCHGKSGAGVVIFDNPKIARIVAPNLTAAVRRYSDGQLATIVRQGLRPDGRSVFVMPAQAFAVMNDADLGRIIAYLKTLPPAEGPAGSSTVGPLGLVGVALGELHTARQLIERTVPPPPAANPQAEVGRYLARSTCAECHGTGLQGESNPDFTSPNLRIVLAYSPEAFSRLMRTGTALGDRELRVMSGVARARFSQLTDDEIAALYAYLHTVNP